MTVGSDKDLVGLRRAGRVVALAIGEMKEALEPGMTTAELDARRQPHQRERRGRARCSR
jgi:methionyl aminopeptidase